MEHIYHLVRIEMDWVLPMKCGLTSERSFQRGRIALGPFQRGRITLGRDEVLVLKEPRSLEGKRGF